MDIDLPRTVGAGAITVAVVAAIYLADIREAGLLGETPIGPGLIITGALGGVALGLLAANLFLA